MVTSHPSSHGMKSCLHLNAMSISSVLLVLVFFFAVFATAQSSPQYGSMTACNGMTVGSPTYGNYGGELNNFVPFPSTQAWNTNIANAALDPNSAALMTKVGSATVIHPLFGQSPADGGIPYIVVDSSETPSVLINTLIYGGDSDVVVAPYPAGDAVPIEDDETDCSGWPDYDIDDAHTLVLDRNTCWLYETFNTNRCNGAYDADSETIWDTINYNARPWGWTSADAAGLSIYAGLEKYTEAASGTVSHAIRFTMDPTLGDANGGYFVLPASHAASSTTTPNLLPEGARLRLRSSFNISGFSAINQAILTGLKDYGMILADNGQNFFIIGDTDPNWNDSDLGNLKTVTAANFDVVQMAPEYKGMDGATAPSDYPETKPTIASFSASGTSVSPGTPVTFNYTVDGTNYNASYSAETGLPYAYIDNIGPQRLSGPCPCSGSVTVTPTATQTYTLYAANAAGQTISSSILVTVAGSTLAPPVFIPSPGSYADKLILPVTMITASASAPSNGEGNLNATFYYTTNGTTPTTASTVYHNSGGNAINIPAAATTTLKAIAVVPGYSGTSAVTSGVYTTGSGSNNLTDTPVFVPLPGTYNTIQTVYFQDATDDGSNGNTVYYTITAGTTGTALGTLPAQYSSDPPTPPTLAFNNDNSCYACPPSAVIIVATTSTIEAAAEGVNVTTESAITTGTFTLVAGTPAFSPAGGSYSGSQTVTISSVTPSATIYYTTNGTTPTTSSAVYSSPITVSASETVEALATYTGFANSAVGSAAYTIGGGTTVATPTFSPAAGTYSSAQAVTISDSTSGSTIYYTTNGTTPTTNSTVYSSPITVSATETVEALATHSGDTNSAVGSAVYTITGTVATPTFSPAAGTYTAAQTVTISDATSGSSIYYTTNGTTPTTASTHYTSAITVSVTQTLEAIATESGYTNSAVGSAAYTINLTAATPTFSPAAGTYSSAQTVTISDTTSGASIYYTTNGTTPTTASTHYTSAVTVSATETLEAIATATGYANSAVGSAAYTISSSSGPPTYVQQCSSFGSYVETASCTLSGVGAGHALMIGVYVGGTVTPSITSSSGTPSTVITNLADYSGEMDSAFLANTTSGSITITATTTSYTNIWITVSEYSGVAASSPLDTSATASLVGLYDSTSVVSPNFNTTGANDLLWSMCYGIPSYVAWYAGTVPITWTGVNSYSPEGTFVEYGVASTAGTYYGQCLTTSTNGGADQASIMTIALKGGSSGPPTAATPTFSPAAGAYGPAQSVTISDTTSGSTIYYTTNGTTPTTASSVYSSAITVSATETLEAIATASGYSQSAVGSAAYTINGAVATPTFSPAAGTYSTAQTVTISDTTSGSAIYYTTNGTTPTTSSSAYSSAITVSATETLKAIATKTGYSNSAVGSAAYTISSSGPPAYLQQCSSFGNYVETASCTLGGVGAGHALMIGVYVGGSVTPTITSSSGTPSTVITNLADYSGEMDSAFLANTASGSITITATTSSYTNIWITVSEYSGVATSSPLDTSATASLVGLYDSTSVSTGNFTTTGANDLLWSMCYGIPSYVAWYAGTVPITWTGVNSYSPEGTFVEYGVASTAGTYYGQCLTTSTNGGADQASIMTIALKP